MISKNGAGIIVLILSLFGIEIGESMVVELISAIGTLISIGLLIWNQVKRPDTEAFLFKKK